LHRCILVLPQGKIFFADLKRVIELVGENISDAEIEEMIKEVSPPTQEPDAVQARLQRATLHSPGAGLAYTAQHARTRRWRPCM
jgi:hypothetical protein